MLSSVLKQFARVDTHATLSCSVYQMAGGPTIGQFEQVVLTAVLSLR
jgi:hypothetical protein